MEDSRHIIEREVEDLVSISEVRFQIIRQPSEILLLTTIVERKNDKVGSQKQNEKEELYSDPLRKSFELDFKAFQRKA